MFETDRQLIEGDLTLPPAGYQSRFSDSLNRGEFEFVPLTNVRVTSLSDGKVAKCPSSSSPSVRSGSPTRSSNSARQPRRAWPRLA